MRIVKEICSVLEIFGRTDNYLDDHLMPFVNKDGLVYICVTGMNKDLHDKLPEELLLSWSPEQLDYIHDMDYYLSIYHEKIKVCKDRGYLDNAVKSGGLGRLA